jgi:hypothetical protein
MDHETSIFIRVDLPASVVDSLRVLISPHSQLLPRHEFPLCASRVSAVNLGNSFGTQNGRNPDVKRTSQGRKMDAIGTRFLAVKKS